MTLSVPYAQHGDAPPHDHLDSPQVSVILCTYNRSHLLRNAVESVLAQVHPNTPAFELIVVDNNSNDATRAVIESIAGRDGRVRYLFEPNQGLSSARNAGIHESRASLIAFIDDDVCAYPDWVAAVQRAFLEHPEVDMVGARVVPMWPAAPPAWLTPHHFAPLAIFDYGDAPILVTHRNPICLVAQGACRRAVFDDVGFFATDLQRVRDGVGSLEDHEFLLRVLRTGRIGLYDPRIVVRAAVQADRLERAYHRRWHRGHGHFHALLRAEYMERTDVGTLVGVPAHLYRQAAVDLWKWLGATLAGDLVRAFGFETRLQFFIGFFQTRFREFLRKPRQARSAELLPLLHALRRKRAAVSRSAKDALEAPK
jgi:glucosyl-dolichyl phosphate glucuronosyltransferase